MLLALAKFVTTMFTQNITALWYFIFSVKCSQFTVQAYMYFLEWSGFLFYIFADFIKWYQFHRNANIMIDKVSTVHVQWGLTYPNLDYPNP